ncbi:methyltransferase type 11 [Leifsonia xyli]|uniref:class I SAM-dependent methyltransferase n=1 Tax=Leifsonia xyli TaxID=1575 RepID=UPI0007CDB3F8|nr:methyltransferase type 11 [Leifsonia xyli]
MPDPMHFDRYAELYDRARPPYPSALTDRLTALGLLGAGVRALDLGAGTGQATRILVEAGMEVTAVEPGGALAARLHDALPAVRVVRSTAEDVEFPAGSFGLVTVATAVHWFDLDVVLPKLHRILTTDGRLAVWRTAYGDPSVAPGPFREAIQRIVDARDAPRRAQPDETDTASWARALESGGLFRTVQAAEFAWAVDLDADAVRDLFTTFSDWTAAEAEEAARAVDELGGVVTEHYLTPLLVLEPVR